MGTILEAALELAANGWAVFPIKARDKKPPLTAHGLKDATTDATTIRAWWEKWPSANVAIAPGADMAVLDVDPRHGGDDTLGKLESEHGALPKTRTVRTGGGGKQFYFLTNGFRVRNTTSVIGNGLDTKTSGGYVMAPPSIHPSGNSYEWIDDGSVATMPEWLAKKLREQSPRSKSSGGERAQVVIADGQRNATLTSLAGTMRKRGMSEPALESALMAENSARCSPPLPEAEVRSIARSVGRYPTSNNGDTKCPRIIYTGRQLHDITTEAIEVLDHANVPPELFVRGMDLARVGRSKEGQPIIEIVGEHRLRARLAAISNSIGIKSAGKGEDRSTTEFECFPKRDVIQNILAQGAWPFPSLLNVIEGPVLRPDGTIFATPGYDPVTKLYFEPAPEFQMPEVPEQPTKVEATSALDLLMDVISDFPFADDSEAEGKPNRANALGLLITPVVRPAISGKVPLCLIDAPQAGTGKGLLAQVACVIATGTEKPMTPAPNNDEEWRKKLTASLISGTSLLIIDNVEGKLEAPSLALLLTAAVWEDRVLKESRNINLPVRLITVATGNNLELGGDLPRRCYWIRMDAKKSQPWTRNKFTHPGLLTFAAKQRGKLLAAILTLARAWFVAGKPKAEGLPVIGSFEEWSETVGGVLAHAGVRGFLGNLERLYARADASELQWEEFLTTVKTAVEADTKSLFTNGTFAAGSLINEIAWNAELKKALPDGIAYEDANPRRSQTKLRLALSKRDGRRYGKIGLHLEKQDAPGKGNVWKVVTD